MIRQHKLSKPVLLDSIVLVFILFGILLLTSCTTSKPVAQSDVTLISKVDTAYHAGIVNVQLPKVVVNTDTKLTLDSVKTVKAIEIVNGDTTVTIQYIPYFKAIRPTMLATNYATAEAYVTGDGILKLKLTQKDTIIRVLKDSLNIVITNKDIIIAKLQSATSKPPERFPKAKALLDNIIVYLIWIVLMLLLLVLGGALFKRYLPSLVKKIVLVIRTFLRL